MKAEGAEVVLDGIEGLRNQRRSMDLARSLFPLEKGMRSKKISVFLGSFAKIGAPNEPDFLT